MTGWTGPTVAGATCPECGGPRLYNLVFRHVVPGCPLSAALDATQAHDAKTRSIRIRPATVAELALCAALGAQLVQPVSAHILSHPPVWLRVYTDAKTNFDPDLETP